MKKLYCTAMCLLLAALLLAGCGGGSLPDGIDAEVAEARAKEIITAMNDGDFEQVVALYDGVEKYGHTPPTAETWAASMASIEEQMQLGAFEAFTTTRFATAKDDTLGGEYGVVIVGAKYGKKSVAWRVSFDRDMDIIGLRI